MLFRSLFGYAWFLIHLVYTSYSQMHIFALDRFQTNVKNEVYHLGYFLSERKQDLQVLSKDKTIQAYFLNKALGMTWAYGLKGSLYNINAKLKKYLQTRTFAGKNIYSRIALINCDKTVLANTQSENKNLGILKWHKQFPRIKNNEPSLIIDKNSKASASRSDFGNIIACSYRRLETSPSILEIRKNREYRPNSVGV